MTAEQIEHVQAALQYLLDEDHAADPPGWLEERCGVTAAELADASAALAEGQSLLRGVGGGWS